MHRWCFSFRHSVAEHLFPSEDSDDANLCFALPKMMSHPVLPPVELLCQWFVSPSWGQHFWDIKAPPLQTHTICHTFRSA